MSKSVIYAGNSNTQTTTANGTTIQFNNVVRRYGCNLSVNNGNVVAKGSGYYNGTVSLTVDGTSTGTLTVQLYANGTAIDYAYASVATETGSLTTINIPFVVRNNCDCDCASKTITVVGSGVVADITNASIVVEKE